MSLLRSQIRGCRRREPWQTAEQQRTEQELQAKSVAKSVTAVASRRSPRTAPRFVSRLGVGAGPRKGGKSRPQKPPFSPFNLASKGRLSEEEDGGGGGEASRFLKIASRVALPPCPRLTPEF